MNPSVGVVLTNSNSVSRGYLAFLACIDSWSRIADKILIVDGGTTDDTYDRLKSWTSASNWEIHDPPEAYWLMNNKWHAGQWTISNTIGLNKIDTDWAFVVNGDYILEIASTENLSSILDRHKEKYLLSYNRMKLTNSGKMMPTHMKGYIFNMRKIRKEGMNIGFGVSKETNILSDPPILLEEKTCFEDPVNGSEKALYKGRFFPPQENIDLLCFVYGHFFYNYEQLLSKLMEFNIIYNVRYAKRAIKTKKDFMLEFGLISDNRILSKEAELAKPHPKEIKRVINEFYSPEMIGHSAGVVQSQPMFVRNYVRFKQAVKRLAMIAYRFPSVEEKQVWGSFSKEPETRLDLHALYEQQDVILKRFNGGRGY